MRFRLRSEEFRRDLGAADDLTPHAGPGRRRPISSRLGSRTGAEESAYLSRRRSGAGAPGFWSEGRAQSTELGETGPE